MGISAIADWTWNPPALALALSQGRSSAGRTPDPVRSVTEQMLRQCIVPVLSAADTREFLVEINRKLPLFATLQVKLLEEIVADSRSETEPPAVTPKYAAFTDRVSRWSEELDDVTRAELDFALATLHRSNELLWQNPKRGQDPGAADFAELFRATRLADFLFSCLWRLIELGQRPKILKQVVYSLRYAVLDYAAMVRRLLESGASPPALESEPGGDSGEYTFWATVGTLPLFELGDAA